MVDQYVSRKVQPVLQELQNGLLMDGYDWTSSQPLNGVSFDESMLVCD
jgi:hypothetical protein